MAQDESPTPPERAQGAPDGHPGEDDPRQDAPAEAPEEEADSVGKDELSPGPPSQAEGERDPGDG